MIKRDITETVYEYDKEGKLVKKTVIETHEEENNTVTTYPSFSYLNGNVTNPCEALPCTLATKSTYTDDSLSTASSAITTKTNVTTATF